MKTIRALYRQFNLNATASGKAKMKKSLVHSLRLMVSEQKPEWDTSLSAGNLLWYKDEIVTLDSVSLEQREAILHATLPPPMPHNRSQKKSQLRKLKHKLKKYSKGEREKGHLEASGLLENLWYTGPQDVIDEQHYLNHFMPVEMMRKNQKLDLIRKFIALHNELSVSQPNSNATYLQEGIIKIPHRWGIGLDVISANEWLEFTEQFLTYYFPAYPIHFMAAHVDERLKNESTGTHCHYFLLGRDSNFGNWDILKTQIEVVNEYIRKKNQEPEHDEELLPENCVLNREQMALHGEHLQSMFRDFINEHFLHERELHVERAPESERRSEERKQMNREAKLAKSERSFNYQARLVEEQEKQLALLQAEVSKQRNKLKELYDAHEFLHGEIHEKKEELSTLEKRAVSKQYSLQSLDTQLSSYQNQIVDSVSQLQGLNKKQHQLIANLLADAFHAEVLQSAGFNGKAEVYFTRIANTLDNEIELSLRPLVQDILQAAVQSAEDSEGINLS